MSWVEFIASTAKLLWRVDRVGVLMLLLYPFEIMLSAYQQNWFALVAWFCAAVNFAIVIMMKANDGRDNMLGDL